MAESRERGGGSDSQPPKFYCWEIPTESPRIPRIPQENPPPSAAGRLRKAEMMHHLQADVVLCMVERSQAIFETSELE